MTFQLNRYRRKVRNAVRAGRAPNGATPTSTGEARSAPGETQPGGETRAGVEPAPRRAGGQMTVADGWESYARNRRDALRVGDVWNDPERIGMDVESAEDVVPYLDRTVFEPFLGSCDVMLEIGPGAGRFTEVLLPRCRRLLAVDTSPTMLELLSERFAADSRLECHQSDGRGLGSVADSSVDAAFSYGVFVHLQPWDIYNYLAELNRVLKPGGKALIQHSSTLSELGWQLFTESVQRQVNRHKLPWTFAVNTPELMREFVERAGLECLDLLTEVARRDCIALIRKPAG